MSLHKSFDYLSSLAFVRNAHKCVYVSDFLWLPRKCSSRCIHATSWALRVSIKDFILNVVSFLNSNVQTAFVALLTNNLHLLSALSHKSSWGLLLLTTFTVNTNYTSVTHVLCQAYVAYKFCQQVNKSKTNTVTLLKSVWGTHVDTSVTISTTIKSLTHWKLPLYASLYLESARGIHVLTTIIMSKTTTSTPNSKESR